MLGKIGRFFGATGDQNPAKIRDLQLKQAKKSQKRIEELESQKDVDKGQMQDAVNVSKEAGQATSQAMLTGNQFDPNQARALGEVGSGAGAAGAKAVLDAVRQGRRDALNRQYSFFTTTGESAMAQAANERDAGTKGLGAIMEGVGSGLGSLLG